MDSEPRYAWVMAAIGTAMVLLNFGALTTIAAFLKPMADEFGWARGSTALAYTWATLAVGLGGVAWGRFADRYGSRVPVLFGAVMQGVTLFLMSRVGTVREFYLFYVLFGGLGFAAVNVPLVANVGLWFTRNKGLALGIVSAGGALGNGLVSLVAAELIARGGWRFAYLVLGAAYLFMTVPLALMVRTPPALRHETRAAANDHGAPLLSPAYVTAWLSAAAIFCCVTMAVPIVHIVPLMTDRGMPYRDAIRLFFVVMAAGVLGRLVLGKVSDYLGGLRSYLLASALQTAVVFWFTRVESVMPLYVIGVLFGIGYSAVMTALWVCVRELVPARVAATCLGVVALWAWAGMGLGGWQGGHLFDVTGAYTSSYALAAFAGIVNLALVGLLTLRLARARTPDVTTA